MGPASVTSTASGGWDHTATTRAAAAAGGRTSPAGGRRSRILRWAVPVLLGGAAIWGLTGCGTEARTTAGYDGGVIINVHRLFQLLNCSMTISKILCSLL